MATTSIYIEAFAHYAADMRVPRTLITPHPMGRPVGAPGDAARQRQAVEAALALIHDADAPGFSRELPGSYR